jgi:hypothetical protein
MLVFLNPIEAAGWLDVLRKNSIATAYGYGRFLGKRYGKFTNIIWFHGNDFQTWRTRSDTLRVQAVARGIRAEAPKQLQTVELNYLVSSSLDDPTWRRLIAIDSVYTYAPTYAELLKAYNRPRRLPSVMVEANYEFEAWHYATDLETLRRQEYWSMLSGASGQFYGNKYTWQFSSGWKSHVDTPGSRQMILASNFFRAIPWFDLVPDQRHTLLTAGYGTFADSGPINPNDYATAAGTSDRKLAIVYVPTVRPVTVDMAKLKGRVLARWYDPTNGRYTRVSGPLLSNSGERRFTPPGKNGDGDGDWVLTLATR